MLEAITIAELAGQGLIFARTLQDLGCTPRHIDNALRARTIYRVRRGVYARPIPNGPGAGAARHRLLVRATIAMSRRDLLVSHHSAAAMHGLPIIGAWPSRVHVTTPGASGGSSSAGLTSHLGSEPSDVVEIGGVTVTTPERTIADVARVGTFLVGVVMLDHALRSGAVVKHGLAAELPSITGLSGVRRVRAVIDFADSRSGSVGESLSRVRMRQLGYADPELQIEVLARGRKREVDFGWEKARLFGEFDGVMKYSRARELSGKTAAEVVVEEKVREDAIREATDRSFVRWLWAEALSPETFDARLREAGVPRRRR